MKSLFKKLAVVLVIVALCEPAMASNGINPDVAYMLNTLLILVCGVLVMFMAAGFAMLEAGMVRSKSVATILAKNVALYAVASLMFFVVGFNLMYGESVLGLFGEFAPFIFREGGGAAIDTSSGMPSGAGWFFQMVFVATAASVVSGALAERVRVWPFLFFVVALTGFMYPVIGHWTWGGGWLSTMGFTDFAGSTIVHSVGGWAALAGILLLGSRRGRFDSLRCQKEFAPSSLPMVTLGTFILWLGWFGFNGGSQLSFSTIDDAFAVATIFVNTNAAAAGGVVVVLLASQLFSRRLDLPLILNGALAGLVSITAEPLAPTMLQAILIGAAGGMLMIIATKLMESMRLDDVVGAIPVHLVGGIWGTLAVSFSNPDAKVLIQLAGVLAIGTFIFFASCLCWLLLRGVIGIRLKQNHEFEGSDLAEIGMRAYNIA
jgi:Amt family ammonium transporter